MENISGILKEELRHLVADIVGIGEITMLPVEARKNMSFGIAVAVAINSQKNYKGTIKY